MMMFPANYVAASGYTPAWQNAAANTKLDYGAIGSTFTNCLFCMTFNMNSEDNGSTIDYMVSLPSGSIPMTVQKLSSDRFDIKWRNSNNDLICRSIPTGGMADNTDFMLLAYAQSDDTGTPTDHCAVMVIDIDGNSVSHNAGNTNGTHATTHGFSAFTAFTLFSASTSSTTRTPQGDIERAMLWLDPSNPPDPDQMAAGTWDFSDFVDANGLVDPSTAIATHGTPLVGISGANFQTPTDNHGSAGDPTLTGSYAAR